jgi:hypothetical protein
MSVKLPPFIGLPPARVPIVPILSPKGFAVQGLRDAGSARGSDERDAPHC